MAKAGFLENKSFFFLSVVLLCYFEKSSSCEGGASRSCQPLAWALLRNPQAESPSVGAQMYSLYLCVEEY